MRRQTGAGCDVIVCSDLRTGARGITTQPTTLEETSRPEAGIPTDRNSVPITNDPTTTHFLDIFTFSPLDHEWSDLAPGLDEQLSCILSSRRISSHDTHHFAPACGGHCLDISFFLVLNNNHIHIFFSSGFNGGGYLLVSATAISTYACEPRREKLGYRCLVNFEENHGPGYYVACLMRLRLVLFC